MNDESSNELFDLNELWSTDLAKIALVTRFADTVHEMNEKKTYPSIYRRRIILWLVIVKQQVYMTYLRAGLIQRRC